MKRRKLRLRFWFAVLWCLLLVAAGLWLTAYMALRPEAVEARVRAELARLLRYPVAFQDLVFSWKLGARFRQLDVSCAPPPAGGAADASSPRVFLHAGALEVVPDYWELVQGRLEFSRVVLESPEVRLLRRPDGTWNFQEVLRGDRPADGAHGLRGGGGIRTFILRGGTVALEDQCTFGDSFSCTLKNLRGTLTSKDGRVASFQLGCETPCGSIEIAGARSAGEGEPSVRISLDVRRIELAALERFLPASAVAALKDWRLKGFGRVRADLELKNGRFVLRGAEAQLLTATISSPNLPYSIKGLRGVFRLEEKSLEIRDFKGAAGGAEISASGKLGVSGPWLSGRKLLEGAVCERFEVALDSFDLEGRLRAFLPRGLQKLYDDYQPSGRFSLLLKTSPACAFPPPVEAVSVSLKVEDGAFRYTKFPYRISHLKGEIVVEKGRWMFRRPLRSLAGGVLITVGGRGAELRPDGEVDVLVKARNAPLDERLRSALPADTKKIWDAFQLAGFGDSDIHIWRSGDSSVATKPGDLFAPPESLPKRRKANVRIEVRLKGIRLCYKKFVYDLEGVTGSLDIDLKSRQLSLADLKGRHGNVTVTADGSLHYGQPYFFELLLQCASLPVEKDLVAALPQQERALVESLGLRGRVRAAVRLQSTAPGKTAVTSDLGIIDATVRHEKFPYELRFGEGRVEVSERAIRWTGLASPPGVQPYVVLSGDITTEGEKQSIRFNMDAAGVSLNDELRGALPRELRQFVESMNLGGTYQGRVETVCEIGADGPGSYRVRYTGKNIRVKSGFLDFGLKAREVEAEGSFVGTTAGGTKTTLEGDVQVKSAWFNRLHLGKGTLQIALGKPLESLVEGKAVAGTTYVPSKPLLDRVRGERAREAIQMLIHSDDLYGGKLDGLVYVDTGDSQQIGGEFVTEGVQVGRSVKDVFGSPGARAAGAARGKVWFQGKRGDFRSLTGRGDGVVENARLAEVPLFFGLLSILYGDASSRRYFNHINLDFKIADGRFEAKKGGGVEILSPAVTLAGGGTMDFKGNLDLLLQPHITDFEIPVVEQILVVLKKGLAQISIRGDLSKPDVQFVTGAGMVRFDLKTEPKPGEGSSAREGAPKKAPPGTPAKAPAKPPAKAPVKPPANAPATSSAKDSVPE